MKHAEEKRRGKFCEEFALSSLTFFSFRWNASFGWTRALERCVCHATMSSTRWQKAKRNGSSYHRFDVRFSFRIESSGIEIFQRRIADENVFEGQRAFRSIFEGVRFQRFRTIAEKMIVVLCHGEMTVRRREIWRRRKRTENRINATFVLLSFVSFVGWPLANCSETAISLRRRWTYSQIFDSIVFSKLRTS